MASVFPCVPACICVELKLLMLTKQGSQLAERKEKGEKQERHVHVCAGPSAGHCHVISHVEGYPCEGLKFTRTHIQRYAYTHKSQFI